MPVASRSWLYLAMVFTEVVKSALILGRDVELLEPFLVVITITPLDARDP